MIKSGNESHGGCSVRAYELAIDVLSQIRESLVATGRSVEGRSVEFEAELERIREEQRRRHTLLSMLGSRFF